MSVAPEVEVYRQGSKLTAGFLVAVSVAACSHSDKSLERAITAVIDKGPGTEVRLSTLTSFRWQKLHVFPPYTTTKEIESALGFHWSPAENVSVLHQDHSVLLVFVDSEHVVSFVEYPRARGDFAELGRGGPWTPESAVFVVGKGFNLRRAG